LEQKTHGKKDKLAGGVVLFFRRWQSSNWHKEHGLGGLSKTERKMKKHTTGDGVGETLGRILLCTDIAGRTGLESEHSALAQRSWAKGNKTHHHPYI